MRSFVDRLLDRPFGGRIAESSKGSGGDFVCVNQIGLGFYVRVLVASVVAHGRHPGNGGRFRRVMAAIGYRAVMARSHAPVSFLTPVRVNFRAEAWPAASQKLFLAGSDDLD